MEAVVRIGLLLSLVLFGSAAYAEPAPKPKPAPRFVPLLPQWVARMPLKKQAAIRSVAQLRNASGFVIHEDGNGKALLLTNEHVTRSGVSAGELVTFHDGQQARTVRLLHSNPQLDYGLIEIDLPAGANRAAELEPSGLTAGRKVYGVAGFANLGFKDLDATVAGGQAAHALIQGGQLNHFSLAPGHVFGDEFAAQSINTSNTTVLGKLALMPNAPGMSGSPIFGHSTHKVVALHSSGNASPTPYWEETSIPLGLIMKDLGAQAMNGTFDPQARRLVDALLTRAQ